MKFFRTPGIEHHGVWRWRDNLKTQNWLQPGFRL